MTQDSTTAIETTLAHAAEARDMAGALYQSLLMVRENWEAVPVALPVRLVWHEDYPSGVYPTLADWDIVRGAIDGGAVVFASVGASSGALKTVRILSLIGAGEPTNASVLFYDELDNAPKRLLCPTYGATPRLAVWSIAIYGTRTIT